MRTPKLLPTRTELATQAFLTAENSWFSGADPTEVVKAYFAVYKDFAETPIAEKSLFVAAWLTDNALNKKKSAKALYDKVCERFPKSVYCTQGASPRVKSYLDTLAALRKAGLLANENGTVKSTDSVAANRSDSATAKGTNGSDSLILKNVKATDSSAIKQAGLTTDTLKQKDSLHSSGRAPGSQDSVKNVPVPKDSVRLEPSAIDSNALRALRLRQQNIRPIPIDTIN